jgi:hypothetical protein
VIRVAKKPSKTAGEPKMPDNRSEAETGKNAGYILDKPEN